MKNEKWIIAHFSPTGGTKKVADAIAAGLDAPVVEMDLTKEDVRVPLGDHDALIAVLPVFAPSSVPFARFYWMIPAEQTTMCASTVCDVCRSAP